VTEQREGELFAALPAQIARAKGKARYLASLLAYVNSRDIASRKALAQLPITRKSDPVELQKQQAPFGGLNPTAPGGGPDWLFRQAGRAREAPFGALSAR
jgi:phenylacetate-CoA ligase